MQLENPITINDYDYVTTCKTDYDYTPNYNRLQSITIKIVMSPNPADRRTTGKVAWWDLRG